jgi:hypothetical protein
MSKALKARKKIISTLLILEWIPDRKIPNCITKTYAAEIHFDPLVIHGLRIGNATSSRNTRMLISKRKPSPAPTAIWFKKLLENFEPSLELSSFKVHTFPISTNAAQLTIENNFARYSKFNSSFTSPG